MVCPVKVLFLKDFKLFISFARILQAVAVGLHMMQVQTTPTRSSLKPKQIYPILPLLPDWEKSRSLKLHITAWHIWHIFRPTRLTGCQS